MHWQARGGDRKVLNVTGDANLKLFVQGISEQERIDYLVNASGIPSLDGDRSSDFAHEVLRSGNAKRELLCLDSPPYVGSFNGVLLQRI